MQISWKEFALATCVLASGCSSGSTSGSGGGNCSSFTACGGNVVGTWNFTKACVTGASNPLAMSCPSSTYSVSESLGGSVTFTATTYTSTTSGTANESFTIPSSCLNGATCDQLQMGLQQPDAGATGACTSSSGGCSCTVTATAPSTSENGTYATSGNTITLTPANGGTSNPAQYCVQGNTLLVEAEAPDGGLGGTVIVATK
jgi:hypothetical protein